MNIIAGFYLIAVCVGMPILIMTCSDPSVSAPEKAMLIALSIAVGVSGYKTFKSMK